MKLFGILRSRGVAVKASSAAVLLVGSAAANAALPEWASTISTQISGAITDSAAMVGPLFALSIGTVLVFKFIRRFTNKV